MKKHFEIKISNDYMRGYVHLPKTSNNKIIIFVNGYQTSLSNGNKVQDYMSNKLADANFTVYRFDAIGYGESDGDFEKTFPTTIKNNLIILINKIHDEFSEKEIILVGTSMGGMIVNSIIQENEFSFVNKSILMCPALDFYNIYQSETFVNRDVMPMQIKDYESYRSNFINDLKNYFWSKSDSNHFNGETLIIHGNKDEVVNYNSVKEYAQNNNIQYVEIDNADHTFKSIDNGYKAMVENDNNINLILEQIIKFGGK